MDPRFPDLVEEWAREPGEAQACVNDNGDDGNDFTDLLLAVLARLEIGSASPRRGED